MKRILYICAALFPMAVIAQTMVDISPKKPYVYEKRNGKLRIQAFARLNQRGGNARVLLNNEAVELIPTAASDSLVGMWLPLVGEKQSIRIYLGKAKEPVAEQLYTPLIPSDWGYFQQGTIHVISSSHQDVAWMNTPDSCRHDRIYNIINPAMDMLKEDKDFAFGMEQTLNLMEFLDEFPNRKDEVMKHYKDNRFAWGATYNQPYEGLESGEQLVRQAYYGRKWIKENLPGCDDVTAYNIDVPGRTWQMPQIYARSGIKNLFISRMREGLYDWSSPDGSKVFTFTPGNYGWAVMIWKFLEEDAVTGFNTLHERSVLWSNYFRERGIPPHYAVVISNDSEKPANYKPLIDEWNRIADLSETPLPHIRHSTAEHYFSTVNVPEARMEEVSGERPDLWLYIHGPAHYEAIRAKREAGVLLPAAEMFTTFNALSDENLSSYPRSRFDKAWMSSIYPDHGWGGKNGDITDSIFRSRLESARDEGADLFSKAVSNIVNKINVKQESIVVFNDLPWERTDVVTVEVPTAQAGKLIVKDSEGNKIPAQWKQQDGKTCIVFIAEAIPSVGYKTYSLSAGKEAGATPSDIRQEANYYTNSFYEVTFGNGGMESLFDKQLGREVLNTTKFAGGDILNVGYKGNGAGEFTQSVSPEAGDLRAISHNKALWSVVEEGPVYTVFENKQSFSEAGVVQRIRIYHRMKKMDMLITLADFDGTHSRQFRLALPLNMRERTINYEVPMGVLEVGRDEMKQAPEGWAWGGTYRQRPEEINPREVQNFISASGNGIGVTLSSCVAVADWIDPSRESADYPMLQGILLSSHKSCHGLGNWYEQKGTHNYSFSLLSHSEGWQNGYHFGVEANHPLRAVKKTNRGGTLPAEQSFLRISNPFVALSIVKKADDGQAVIIRLTEMKGEDTVAKVELPWEVKRVVRTNLIEEEETIVPTSGRTLSLPLGHHAIETFRLEF